LIERNGHTLPPWSDNNLTVERMGLLSISIGRGSRYGVTPGNWSAKISAFGSQQISARFKEHLLRIDRMKIDWGLSMWNRVPLLLRALLATAAVTGTATVVWGGLIQSNLRYWPRLPWATVIMAVFLVFYWKFLKGWGWPRSTAAARRAGLRAEPLCSSVWRWSMVAGGLGLAASIVLFILSHRLMRWPQPAHSDLSHIPLTTLLPGLLMSAMVAGISEEAGFRGYMQGPLERQYGPAMGIAITSIVFGLAHLSHGAFLPAILFDIGWGALYGLLTYRTGSILPAIVLHSSGDALEFVAAWKFPPSAPAPLVWATGADPLLWFDCILAVLLGGVSVWAFRRLARTRRNASVGSVGGGL
jgi:membrane protease YdiL (CAAX protease family)